MLLAFLVVVLAVSTLFQIITFVRLGRAFAWSPTFPESDPVPVSVVICARNEHENLRQLLPMLATQEHPDFEVILVDDRSDDGTEEVVRAFVTVDSRFRYVRIDRTPDHTNPKKYGLTLGIKAARHEAILLTDADCRPVSTQWVASMSRHLDASVDIVLGLSPYERRAGLLNSFIQYETLLTAFQYAGWALRGKPYMGVGRNLCYRKSMFLNNKGFNSHIGITGGDDDLLVNRLATAANTILMVHPDSFTQSIPKVSWRDFFRQKLRHLAVGKHYQGDDKLRLGFFMLSHLLVWVLGFTLLFFPETRMVALSLLGVRGAALVLCLDPLRKLMAPKIPRAYLIFLDFVYMFYYLSTGVAALTTKRISWKN